jgi:hypothetical protein
MAAGENLEDALTRRVLQAKDLRLGSANTESVYYQAMQSSVPDLAQPYVETWTTMAGITEGMKNTHE